VWYSASGTRASQFDGTNWSCPYVLDANGRQANMSATSDGSDDGRTVAYIGGDGCTIRCEVDYTYGPPPLLAPQQSSPTNGATNVTAGAVTLSWNSVSAAATYDLQVATNPIFTLNVRNFVNIPVTWWTVYDIAYSTTYYWACELGEFLQSGWSLVSSVSFTTQAPPPPPPPPPPPCNCCPAATAASMPGSLHSDRCARIRTDPVWCQQRNDTASNHSKRSENAYTPDRHVRRSLCRR